MTFDTGHFFCVIFFWIFFYRSYYPHPFKIHCLRIQDFKNLSGDFLIYYAQTITKIQDDIQKFKFDRGVSIYFCFSFCLLKSPFGGGGDGGDNDDDNGGGREGGGGGGKKKG